MSEQRALHESQSDTEAILGQPRDLEDLAAEFNKLSQQRDPAHQAHVISQHQERPESFRWFVAGVMFERARPK